MTPEELRIVDQLIERVIHLAPEERDAALVTGAEGDARILEAARLVLKEAVTADDPWVAQSPTDEDPDLGRRIGPYLLRRKLGEGGFGVVYLAERRQPVHQQVALKLIRPGMNSKTVLGRFEQERAALAVMDHPNVAKIFDAGSTTDGRPYFVMEMVRGEPITEYADRQTLDTAKRLQLFCQVCDAVQHAHNKGVIHRDIKPSNVLVSVLDSRVLVKVIDFGVAKAVSPVVSNEAVFTEHGQLVGTPEYMSPEQAEMGATDIDTRADVYSLGVLLYEMISGTLPFDSHALRAAGFDGIRRMIRDVDPPRPSVKLSSMGKAATGIAGRRKVALGELTSELQAELEWIPLRAIRKDRTERYRTAAELADDVRRYLDGKPLLAGPESALYRFSKFVKRNRRSVLAASALVAVALVGTVGTTSGVMAAISAEAARDRADEEVARERVEAEVTAEILETIITADAESIGADEDASITGLVARADSELDRREDEVSPIVYASMRHVLAKEMIAIGAGEEGESRLRDVIAFIRREIPGELSLLAEATFHLAEQCWGRERTEEAISLFEEAIRLAELAEPNGVDLAFYRAQYAGVPIALAIDAEGKERDAYVTLATELLDQAERIRAVGTRDAIRTYYIARGQRADMMVVLLDEVDKGLSELRTTVEAQLDAGGRSAFDAYRNTLQLLYFNLVDLNRNDDALALCEMWVHRADEMLGRGNRESVNARMALAAMYMNGGKSELALTTVEEALDELRSVHGDRGRAVGVALRIQIGPFYGGFGFDRQAIDASREADLILGPEA